MTTTINNEHKKLNFSSERDQSQACLNSAEHEKNQGRKVLNVPNLRFPEFQGEWKEERLAELSYYAGIKDAVTLMKSVGMLPEKATVTAALEQYHQ